MTVSEKTLCASRRGEQSAPVRLSACREELRTGLLVTAAVTLLLGTGLARALPAGAGAAAPDQAAPAAVRHWR